MTDNPSSSNNWSFGRSLLLLLISFDLLAVAIWLVVYHSYYQAVTEVVGGIWGAVVAFLGYLKIKTSRTKSLPEFLGLLPVKMTILAYTILIVIFMSFYLLAQFPVHTVLVTATLNGRPQGGVEIFWDNARKGRTGNDGLLKISSVTRGHHDLRAALEGFPEETKEKIFVGAGLKLSVEVEFDSARILKGNLFVDSNPRGAEIFINGKKKEGLRTPKIG
ncbi:MAG: hypothetical protein ONB05_10960, partial [candidate division KSB1 bacterium]|nr:hypothetical protein [candidate division KSB1 bacterium]